MPRTSPASRRPRTFDPFLPRFSQKLAHAMKALLTDPRVAEINFDFGSVLVHHQHFRGIAQLIAQQADGPGLKIRVDPALLIRNVSDAMYFRDTDTIAFMSAGALEDEDGRALAIHEATHAVCDWRGRSTANRSEEGACFLAAALYLLSNPSGIVVNGYVPEVVFDVAVGVRARRFGAAPVAVRGSEIAAIRREMARMDYANTHITNHDGIGGRRG